MVFSSRSMAAITRYWTGPMLARAGAISAGRLMSTAMPLVLPPISSAVASALCWSRLVT